MLYRLSYFVGKALASARESLGVTLLTSATIGAALVVVGVFAMALQTLEGLTLVWGRSASVAVELRDETTPERQAEVRQRLAELPHVATARLITPEAALAQFRNRGPEAAALVSGVDPAILPPVIELDMARGFADLQALERIAESARTLPEVAVVDYGKGELDRLAALLELLRGGGALVALLIALATAFIVSNTIRLTVYARRDEITILRLVGATNWFVRAPFLVEGVIWGALGALFGAGALWTMEQLFATRLTAIVAEVIDGLEVHFFSAEVALSLAVGALVLGLLGSALAVRRFLEDPL